MAMSFVYKVLEITGDKEVAHFDTAAGASDSFLDADRCFKDVCYKRFTAGSRSVIHLIENGALKSEFDEEKWKKRGGVKIPKGKSTRKSSSSVSGSPTKKSKSKAQSLSSSSHTKVTPEAKNLRKSGGNSGGDDGSLGLEMFEYRGDSSDKSGAVVEDDEVLVVENNAVCVADSAVVPSPSSQPQREKNGGIAAAAAIKIPVNVDDTCGEGGKGAPTCFSVAADDNGDADEGQVAAVGTKAVVVDSSSSGAVAALPLAKASPFFAKTAAAAAAALASSSTSTAATSTTTTTTTTTTMGAAFAPLASDSDNEAAAAAEEEEEDNDEVDVETEEEEVALEDGEDMGSGDCVGLSDSDDDKDGVNDFATQNLAFRTVKLLPAGVPPFRDARLPANLKFSSAAAQPPTLQEQNQASSPTTRSTRTAPPKHRRRCVVKILRGDITKWTAASYVSDDDDDDALVDEKSPSSGGGSSNSSSNSNGNGCGGSGLCCVVNAANERMLGGGGVDGAIHRAAGDRLREHCKQHLRQLSPGVRCWTGQAVMTPSFDLPCDAIVHTVGPVYDGDTASTKLWCRSMLKSAYATSLQVAETQGFEHVAFCALSCGIFGYPLREAAEVAFEAIQEHFYPTTSTTSTAADAAAAAVDGDGSAAAAAAAAAADGGGGAPSSAHGGGVGEGSDGGEDGSAPNALTLRTVSFVMFEKETVVAWLDAAQRGGMHLAQGEKPPAAAAAAAAASCKVGGAQFNWQVAAQRTREQQANSFTATAKALSSARP